MTELLVVLDGASEPRGRAATSLERAVTPALDALVGEGRLSRLRTIPAGAAPGSETAIPVLLGHVPRGPVDRARIEAAARRIPVRTGETAWRVDVHAEDGARAGRTAVAAAAAALAAVSRAHRVHVLAGHRLLVVGPAPLPGAVARTPGLRVWPRGGALPRVLDGGMVVVAAPGAATGVARELGAMVLSPPGATGGPDTDLTAKAVAAVRVLESRSAARVVVHVGGADEAAHVRDAAGKVAFLSRVDAELIAPLAAAARVCGATVRVCPDHGCDPATGEHVADPVPCLDWPGGGTGWRRLSERDAAGAPLVDLTRVTAVAA